MRRAVAFFFVFPGLVAIPLLVSAVEFTPFASVNNVCPDCDSVTRDVVTLSDGTKVRANVIAQNVDFMVVERYGEIRAIPLNRVKSTDWANDEKPSGLRDSVQVVLKNGTVLNGEITEESEKPGHFQLESSVAGSSFTVFKTQIDALYRDGQVVNVTVPSTDGDESSSTSND